MNEIKPCPYCRHFYTHVEELKYGFMARQCNGCDALGPRATSPEEATEKWNRRAYDYDMPAIVRQNKWLKAELNRLQELVYGDGERDTDHVIS